LPEACLIYMVPTSVCLLAVNGDMTISRCELAKILHKEDLDGFEGYSFSDWLCLAFMESNFNISKEHENSDGSFDYGIFQINSHYWYNAYQSHPENFCHVDCRGLARVPGWEGTPGSSPTTSLPTHILGMPSWGYSKSQRIP
uniref:Lysozyme-like protein 6 n=1 Tax=Castor canadensis TaxID=51338 RepID=A0A8C0ZXJ0_CASCN